MENIKDAANTAAESVCVESESTEVTSTEASTKVFLWDEDYARSKKTRYSRLLRVLVMIAFIFAGVGLMLFDSLVLPKDNERNILLILGLGLIIFAAIFVPRFFFEKIYRATFMAFAEHDGKLWHVALVPRRVNSKYGRARQQRYINETFETAQDQDAIIGIIESYNDHTLRGTSSYRRPKVVMLDSVTAELQGKKIKCSYISKSGKMKTMTIFDCYPGLVEYINGEQ